MSLIGLLGIVIVLVAARPSASASSGMPSTKAGTPRPTGTATTPCPGMHCPGNTAPGLLVQNGQYSDERFIDMMVPHHLMAIQMAQVAEHHGEHPEIKQLAAAIMTTQGQEITELKALKQRLLAPIRPRP